MITESIPMLERDKRAYLAYQKALLTMDADNVKTINNIQIYEELAAVSERLYAIHHNLNNH